MILSSVDTTIMLRLQWIHNVITSGLEMKESGLRIRVEKQLRYDFIQTCKKRDLTASQVLRAFMRDYIHKSQLENTQVLIKKSDSSFNGKVQ